MDSIYSTARIVIAHMCDKIVYYNFWKFNNDGNYHSYRVTHMPTIDNLNKFEPSTLRAFCKYIIEYNILNKPIEQIIALIINDVSSPITHEFIVEYTRGNHYFKEYFIENKYILPYIESLNSRTLFYILKNCHMDYDIVYYNIFDSLDEIDVEFAKKLMKLLVSGQRDDAYALITEQFKQRGWHTKPALR